MARPTTIRLPDDLLDQLDARARAHGKDRATFLRDILRDALARDVEDDIITRYAAGELSLTDAAERLKTDPWQLLEVLRARGLDLSVTLEDWMDSRSSL